MYGISLYYRVNNEFRKHLSQKKSGHSGSARFEIISWRPLVPCGSPLRAQGIVFSALYSKDNFLDFVSKF